MREEKLPASSHIENLKSSRVFLIRITFDQISLVDDADISSNTFILTINSTEYNTVFRSYFFRELNRNLGINYCLKVRMMGSNQISHNHRVKFMFGEARYENIKLYFGIKLSLVNGKWKRRFWSRLLNSGHSLHLSAFLSTPHQTHTETLPVLGLVLIII